MIEPQWTKARRCDSHACVEAALVGDEVQVRDSKGDQNSPVLTFSKEEWLAFLGGVRDGDFDFGLVAAAV